MTQPTITVSLGRLTGWTLGTVGKSELGTTTTLATYTYTPITSRVIDFSIRRGRQHELDRIETGTASLTLLNQDGAFTPSNTSSVYYPDIRPMVPIKIQATWFDPSDITGLEAWYDFSDLSTLFQDTARTTPITTDAQILKGVTDKSGAGLHLSEATNGPTYKASIQNGHSVARFDGTNDILASSLSASTETLTWFIVASYDSFATYYSFVGASAGSGFSFRPGGGGDNPGKYQMLKQNVAVIGTSGITMSAATATIAACTYTAAGAFQIWTSGGAQTSGTNDQNMTGGLTFKTAGGAGTTEFPDGDLMELFRYNSVLSLSDINLIGNYLAAKWGATWTTAT